MNDLINIVLSNYIPTIIICSFIVGIFAIAIAGIIRNSGRHDDIAQSNTIIQTVIVGFVMLFVSGAFVFAFHQTYVSKVYSGVRIDIENKLPDSGEVSNTELLSNEIKDSSANVNDPKCILVVVDTVDCVKKTINDIIGTIIEKVVRGIGSVISKIVEKFNFNFLFHLPAELFDSSDNLPADKLQRIINFNSLIRVSEILGLAWVYILIVTHYFKSIILSLDNDYGDDFLGDIGKMLLGFAGVFLARYIAEAVIITAESFATFLFNSPLANGLTIALKALITDALWSTFSGFSIALVGLADRKSVV